MSDGYFSDDGGDSCFGAPSDDEWRADDDSSEAVAEEEEAEEDDSGTEGAAAAVVVPPAPSVHQTSVYTGDVLLTLELAALEGREAQRIDAGADLAHGRTGGSSVALDLARSYVCGADPASRPPYVVVREMPSGAVHRLSLRRARIARSVVDVLPSP